MGDPTLRLLELDARHTELLERLDELDQQVRSVLEDWTKNKELQMEKDISGTVSDIVAA